MQKLKNSKIIISTTLVSLTLASSAFGEVKTKEFSVNQISPAQRYNHEMGTSGQLSYSSSSLERNTDNAEFTTQQSSASAVGHYKLPMAGFAGIGATVFDGKSETKIANEKSDSKDNRVELAPYLGFNFNENFTAAYQVGVNQSEKDDKKSQWTDHSLGLLYHNDSLEAGILYEHEVKNKKENVYDPRIITLHGQSQINDQLTLGAKLNLVQFSVLGDDEDRSDRAGINLTSAYQVDKKWSLEGGLGLTRNTKGETSSDLLASVGTYYTVKDNLQLGTSLAYDRTEMKSGDAEVTGNTYAFAVNANYQF